MQICGRVMAYAETTTTQGDPTRHLTGAATGSKLTTTSVNVMHSGLHYNNSKPLVRINYNSNVLISVHY